MSEFIYCAVMLFLLLRTMYRLLTEMAHLGIPRDCQLHGDHSTNNMAAYHCVTGYYFRDDHLSWADLSVLYRSYPAITIGLITPFTPQSRARVGSRPSPG